MAMEKSLSFGFFFFFYLSLSYCYLSNRGSNWRCYCCLDPQRLSKISFYNHNKTPQADIIPGRSNYLMRISFGIPPVEILAFADTRSDFTWIQCESCPQSQCFKQDTPFFNPKNSSTYSHIPYFKGICTYSIEYKYGFSRDSYATETIILG